MFVSEPELVAARSLLSSGSEMSLDLLPQTGLVQMELASHVWSKNLHLSCCLHLCERRRWESKACYYNRKPWFSVAFEPSQWMCCWCGSVGATSNKGAVASQPVVLVQTLVTALGLWLGQGGLSLPLKCSAVQRSLCFLKKISKLNHLHLKWMDMFEHVSYVIAGGFGAPQYCFPPPPPA